MLINIFLLVPVPIAVMFEAFRVNFDFNILRKLQDHRGKLVIKDRVKEREALFACFVCMDEN
jgi:hypothetical protein